MIPHLFALIALLTNFSEMKRGTSFTLGSKSIIYLVLISKSRLINFNSFLKLILFVF
jgi:hypothetical protein